jgi:excinuclease UvrABC nuclease subunit
MAHKTVKYNKTGAEKLPENKPVVYKIESEGGKLNYVGVAMRGRVQERILEHLNQDKIPGAKVEVEQMPSIQDAKATEARIIARSQPKYNEQGK